MTDSFAEIASRLASLGRAFHARGWALGTSGNFSAVVSRDPFVLAITPSGADKADLTADRILEVDIEGRVLHGHPDIPSDETPVHLAIVRDRGVGAVLHTHSIWATILSDLHAPEGEVVLAGYEMLKGLEGVRTHEHRERVPILDNPQDRNALSRHVRETLSRRPEAHGFLLRRHGLYTWGMDLDQAKRHAETLEFLIEVAGRRRLGEGGR